MSAGLTGNERLAQYRNRVGGLRQQALERYRNGARGIHILAGLSAAFDDLVLDLYRDALQSVPESQRQAFAQQTALVAVGGTGRGELAPYSDIDLLFVHTKGIRDVYLECISPMVRDCWDVGLKLGHSIRTIDETIGMSLQEPQFATAVVEARLLDGDERLFASLVARFQRRVVRFRRGAFIEDCVAARAGEFEEHGHAVQQLQPDIKRSPGGLRDLHLLRWVAFAVYGTADLDLVRMQGGLSRQDLQALQDAQEFLSRVRVDLHFAAGKPQDVLTRDEQLRIAREWDFQGTAGQLPVEVFMQQYFRHSTAISQICRRFVSLHRPRPWLSHVSRFFTTHRANRHFLVNSSEIDALPRNREAVCRDLEHVLRLFELASLYRVTPSPVMLERVKEAVPRFSDQVSTESAALFLSILGRGPALGPLLRSMYDCGVLEKVLPEFAHTRCLLQFNQYHSYTVDEHSLQAVESTAVLDQDPSPLGRVYDEIHRKDILRLALLLHDAGKGYVEDHSDVGRRLAAEAAERLRLSSHLREVLTFLVHKHLLMVHLALRRDASDPDVVLPFSREVGSPEILRMLYVLSCADLKAVGPGVWTKWKGDLLFEFYERTMQVLMGESNPSSESVRVKRIRHEITAQLAGSSLPEEWVSQTLDALPARYLDANSAEQIVLALQTIFRLGPDEVIVHTDYDAERHTIELRIITHDHIGSGCFSKIAGVLTAKRLEILGAQINTSTDGTVLDSFRVVDYDFSGPSPQSRLEEIEMSIKDVLMGRRTVEGLFRAHRRFSAGTGDVVSDLPTRVVIDNDSSDRFTIIDVFAHDRTGLLYRIADTLLTLNLSVALAKISTHLDQVVDVFYVTDRNGGKIHDGQRLELVRDTLVQKIDDLQQHGLAALVS